MVICTWRKLALTECLTSKKLINLEGKTAIVTGAFQGNGRAISNAFIKNGAKCITIDKNNKPSEKDIDFIGQKEIALKADLQSKDEIMEVCNKLKGSLPSIDILVNNAGYTCGANLVDYPIEEWEKTLAINLKAHPINQYCSIITFLTNFQFRKIKKLQ